MVDILQERTKRRDYRLKIIWGCRDCNSKVNIFLHRTKDDIIKGWRNIKQICYLNHHITRPIKQCTVCNRLYSLEEFDCPECEVEIAKLTDLELLIENNEKHPSPNFRLEEIKTEIERIRRYREAQIKASKEV